MQNNTEPPITLDEAIYLRKKLEEIYFPNDDKKVVYDSKEVKRFLDIINSERVGIPKGTSPKQIGIKLEEWYEWLKQKQETTTEIPEYKGQTSTIGDLDQLKNLQELAEKRAEQKTNIQTREKEAVDKFKKEGEKKYQDQQKAEALKEKQTQELLNQFFKSKVVVIPTEEIPEVKLSKENKETLIAAETAAKEDPATTRRIFAEKIQEALNKSEKEYKDSITEKTILKSSAHLVEQLRSLPDHKTIGDISDSPKALNTLSILNPLSNPNSEQMKIIIPDKEAREKFAKEVQILMLTAEAERVVNIAGVKAIFGEEGENIAYSLYGPDTITGFQISSEEKDREEGVEISPREVYEKGKQISNLINKIKGFRNAEEVTSTGLVYYPTYSYSNAAVATKTTLALTKALPMAGAVYGFRQGTLLAHWARYNTPLLTGGGSVPFLTAGGIQNTVLMSNGLSSKILFSKNFATGYSVQVMQFTKGTSTLYTAGSTFGNKAFGVYIGQAGGKVGAGTIAVKATGQVAVKALPAAIASKIGAFLGSAGGLVGVAVGFIGGELVGKLIEKINWPKVKKWFQENGPVLAGVAGLGGLALGGPAVGGLVLFGGLAATGSLSAFATGAFGVLGFIGRSAVIAISTPVIVTLLIIPPLVAFIMLVINNSAYVVPPSFQNDATIPPPPIGGMISSCKENEDTGKEITDRLASQVKNGVVKLLPETVWGRRDGICIKPTMIIMHWSAGSNDNPDGNQRTYDTLVERGLSCQLATDTNDNWLMEKFFEKEVEFPACAGAWNTYSINNEMAGVYFTSNPPPPNLEELDLTYDVTCKVMEQYNIPWSQIRGHYDVPNSGKSDPGRDFLLNVFIPEIKRRCPNDKSDQLNNAR